MRVRDRLWATVRPIPVALLAQIRARPWLHRPMHALAVRASRFRIASLFIQSVLEEHYLTAYEYDQWVVENDTLDDADRAAIAAHVARMADPPTISVVMPVYDTDPRFLREAIGSVRGQLYPHWELCIADDASPGEATWALLQEEAAGDPRIRLVRRETNGHISAASNSALALATGRFVALMDHDDVLPAHALYEIAAEIQAHPDAELIYSDEDKIDEDGHRFDPHFKTGWNPELLLGQNMVKHLAVVRRDLIERLGGFRLGFEGSQDFDLALRIGEAIPAAHIRHLPAILYHWRQRTSARSFSETELDRCLAAARRAVAEHLERTGAKGANVDPLPNAPAYLEVKRAPPSPAPMVSIIVPTRDRASLLKRCIDGVLRQTDYQPFELIIVDNDSVEPETLALFRTAAKDPRVRILPAPGPFNYSAINNRAVAEARGEIVLLLNNDIAMIEPGWLTEMVAQAARPEVGAVGARLLYADGRLQHGGVILGVGGGGNPHVAGHLYSGARSMEKSYFNHLRLARNVSAVTAACLALRRSVFLEAGGLDEENLPVAFNDVDLCLKIGALGYQIIWTPRATLYHLESASRGADTEPVAADRFRAEIAYMRRRWGPVLDDDPFYGPNFDKQHVDYRLAFPPSRARPWRTGV
ncbi:MAG TPA: glycosyltransferase family 2 protein [Phenylobacterium sp.]|nr:glycosyltransferase family 2 protein [Phenylobacterium sp.]